MNKPPITVIIPTYNEERNISAALRSVADYVDQIVIVDSDSTDRTIHVAKEVVPEVAVASLPCATFADKMNAALSLPEVRNNWVMRLDADEVVVDPEKYFHEVGGQLGTGLAGIYCNRRYCFLGHWVKHGGMYPRKVMRIFKKDRARFEPRLVDEKMLVDGETTYLNVDLADSCNKGLLNWLKKHVLYARREALQSAIASSGPDVNQLPEDRIIYEQKARYYRAPVLIRPVLYFLYRLIVQRGYLDGVTGVLYHFLHAFVYREFVDLFIIKNRVSSVLAAK